MQMGQTRIIQVPPGLAYGSKGLKIQGKDGAEEFLVPPDERLQFELTLVQGDAAAAVRREGGATQVAAARHRAEIFERVREENMRGSERVVSCM